MCVKQSVTEVARNFADYINRVAFKGDSFILMRGNKPVAKLCPVPSGTRLGDLPGLLASLPRLSEQDISSLAQDLAGARSELREAGLKNPWQY